MKFAHFGSMPAHVLVTKPCAFSNYGLQAWINLPRGTRVAIMINLFIEWQLPTTRLVCVNSARCMWADYMRTNHALSLSIPIGVVGHMDIALHSGIPEHRLFPSLRRVDIILIVLFSEWLNVFLGALIFKVFQSAASGVAAGRQSLRAIHFPD